MPEPRVVPADNRSQDSSPSRDSAAQTHTTSITRRTTWSGRSCSSERRRLASNSSARPLVYSVSATTSSEPSLPRKTSSSKLSSSPPQLRKRDYPSSISALQAGYVSATEISYPDLQMFFATSILHVHLMQWEDENLIAQAINQCNVIWESIDPNRVNAAVLNFCF
ncbi:hypothetical protein LWI29_009963 [Acer saccharum]|uniref:Uncharacterized protein n=1 Tax=Acer saccharum TaxID=4024 RepID=A0AA39VHF0_ACESA|nr:hypothetical protein LWI29_009963 [Acer saccharum]